MCFWCLGVYYIECIDTLDLIRIVVHDYSEICLEPDEKFMNVSIQSK